MRICSQLLLLFEIQHVFQFNSPCLPVKSSEIPIVSSEIHHFPKIFLNSLTMFPSDVPLIFLRKKITFFHVFPSFKKNTSLPVFCPVFAKKILLKSRWNSHRFKRRYVFALMPSMSLQPDVVSFSAAISSCEKMGQWQQAGVDIAGWGPRNGGRVQLPEKSGWMNYGLWMFMVDRTN